MGFYACTHFRFEKNNRGIKHPMCEITGLPATVAEGEVMTVTTWWRSRPLGVKLASVAGWHCESARRRPNVSYSARKHESAQLCGDRGGAVSGTSTVRTADVLPIGALPGSSFIYCGQKRNILNVFSHS